MRLIDADALLELYEMGEEFKDYEKVLSVPIPVLQQNIKDMPTIEAEPVKRGMWVKPYINFYGHPCHCCSECGFKASYQDKNYCPNCGAKMESEGE